MKTPFFIDAGHSEAREAWSFFSHLETTGLGAVTEGRDVPTSMSTPKRHWITNIRSLGGATRHIQPHCNATIDLERTADSRRSRNIRLCTVRAVCHSDSLADWTGERRDASCSNITSPVSLDHVAVGLALPQVSKQRLASVLCGNISLKTEMASWGISFLASCASCDDIGWRVQRTATL